MVNSNFPAHGNLNIYIDQGLLVIDACGPANIEMVRHYQHDINHYRQKLCSRPWASLALLSGESLLPPAAVNIK